jgi:riboflavin synthase
MFTGIVECAAPVRKLRRSGAGARLIVEVPFARELAPGESVAVNGCCLTVAAISGGDVGFDLLEETLRVTNLGGLEPGSPVNLERALRVGDRLSGHFVQGHVDRASEILDWSPHGGDFRLEVALPEAFSMLVIPRGSIAVDGISLTIADLRPSSFVSWIIPHTATVTNLRHAACGRLVNLEFDMMAKFARRLLTGTG